MRTRLCYAALVLVPLVVYAAAWLGEYGTPADLQQVTRAPFEASVLVGAPEGILKGAFLDISFGFVDEISDLRYLRLVSLALIILCGLALWQSLERGGWSEIDATGAAICLMLAPSAQLAAGWATQWPAVLGSLLALAGFAAVESELEQGGGRRHVAMAGGLLLYLGAALCFFPAIAMGLVPLAGVALARPARQWPDTRKWFWTHLALFGAALLVAWVIEYQMLRGAGLADTTPVHLRLLGLFTHALPLGLAPFIATPTPLWHGIAAGVALAVVGVLWTAANWQRRAEPRLGAVWRLVLPTLGGLFCLVAVIAPTWRPGAASLWPLAGLATVALLSAVRAWSERPGGRPVWHFAAFGGAAAVGSVLAFGQLPSLISAPFGEEWQQLRTAVLRANLPAKAVLQVRLPADAAAADAPVFAEFGGSLAAHEGAARNFVHAALRERFPSGLPKGQSYRIEILRGDAPAAPGATVLVLGAPRE